LFLAFGAFGSEQQKLFIHILPSTLLVSVGYLITIAAANPLHGALVGLGLFGFIAVCIAWWVQNTFFDKVHFTVPAPLSSLE
jgi:ABC-type nitrate/sulfonate/bicarbonate transport system permease component